MQTKEKIIELVGKNLEKNLIENIMFEDIYNANLFDDLGYDSLAFINLIVDIEGAFIIEIPDELLLMENFFTIAQVEKTINSVINIEDNL